MNRKYIIGAIVAAVVVVGVLVGISLAGGKKDDAKVGPLTHVAEVQSEFKGIPMTGNVLGESAAPVKIVEYGDTSCPICRDTSQSVLPQVVQQYVRSGRASLEFRPIAFISRSSERGALGAEAAGMQNRMWPFVSLIYWNQGPETEQDWLTDSLLQDVATKVGLDVTKWKADYAGDAVASRFFQRENAANADNVTGTPTFVVTGPKGKDEFSGGVSLERFQQAVEKVS